MTPDDVPIDLIVHTPGGLVLAAEQIALALVRHKAKVTVFVPHYAMSGGTLLALAAVSYTHLDVYKRQPYILALLSVGFRRNLLAATRVFASL